MAYRRDGALVGISLKGECVKSETGFKSVQGLYLDDYMNFDVDSFINEFVESGIHTTPLPNTTASPAYSSNIDSEELHLKDDFQMAFIF